jgi:uncharacterized protein YjbI with pentapeptide repeats
MPRLSYEDSCRVLRQQGFLESDDIPPLPQGRSRHDDEELGVSFFRTMLADAKLEHLTLPRTFFGRSEIRATSFRDSDLSESTANWNDFIDVDFRGANLSRSDFRACLFERVRFARVNLAGVDFRYCGFKRCDFLDADLTDAKLTQKTGRALCLSDEQQGVIDWQAEDGDEPDGG